MPSSFKCSYYRTYFGQKLGRVYSVSEALRLTQSGQVDFVTIPIRRASDGKFDDLVDIRGVSTERMGSTVVGVLSHPSSANSRLMETAVLAEEMSWAQHAGMYAVRLDAQCLSIDDLNTVLSVTTESSVTRVWLSCSVSSWSRWNAVRTQCPSLRKASVHLTDLAEQVDPIVYRRWLGEPVAAFDYPSSPIGDSTASFVLALFQSNAQPIITETTDVDDLRDFLRSAAPLTWEEEYAAPYYDTLQLPLQPLAENMENGVYETFEADRGKYDLYEAAVFCALESLLSEYPDERLVRLAVVGAGRGGLIDSALRAIGRVDREAVLYKVIAVEKNPNAARTLRYRAFDDLDWAKHTNVTISVEETDMREWKPEAQVDILISELLGSLGDNEASPECIDGVIGVVDPIRGVSIPRHYVSTIEPVSCQRIWNSALETNRLEHVLVVYFKNAFRPCQPLPLFEFTHDPSPVPMKHTNERTSTVNWQIPVETLVHGFAGYFHCDLFGDSAARDSDPVVMSTHPPTRSKDMMSWFPAFLPLKEPVTVPAGETLAVEVSRRVEGDKLWLEWTVKSPVLQESNNANGSAYTIGL